MTDIDFKDITNKEKSKLIEQIKSNIKLLNKKPSECVFLIDKKNKIKPFDKFLTDTEITITDIVEHISTETISLNSFFNHVSSVPNPFRKTFIKKNFKFWLIVNGYRIYREE